MKSKIGFVFLLVITVAATVWAITLTLDQRQAGQRLAEERYQRLLTEEKLGKATSRLKSLERQLQDAQSKMKNIQTILSEEESEASRLKQELEEARRAKEQEKEMAEPAADSPESVPATEGQ